MKPEQLELIEQIRKAEIAQNERWLEYWYHYSHYLTWQFWLVLLLFVIPLILVVLFIDRRKIFLLGFYGYSVHVFFGYTDIFGVNNGYWTYPYKLLPILPASITLDASLIPVIFMLFYQYLLNHGKNYYLWMLGLCLFLGYVFKPLMVGLGLFHFGGKENFFLLFLGYAFTALIAKIIMNIFLYLSKSNKFSLHRG
ncbi:CBO0543 family protein [Bacillus sp. FJAT-27251]|uniref:CBO0543 family protein n=1 Tax=Bacillus sp. FJAT-27251 TaxID=1684142 RepID=UPI0006A7EE91|nr:CBO0543 family protein [Bacillus sp. FJAT-27251]